MPAERAAGRGPNRLPLPPDLGVWRWSLLAAALLPLLSGCVYFNTYYNAQRYFRLAEKARSEQEVLGQPGGDAAGQRGGGRRGQETYQSLYEKAARRASIVLEKYPESDLVDDAMFLAGRALFWQSDYFYAARSFRDLENHFPDSEYYGEARLWRGRCLEAQGVYPEARSVYRELFEAGDGDLGARAGFRLGELAATEGDHVVAIDEYRAVLGRYPAAAIRAEAWLRLGEAELALQDEAYRDSALVAFARAAATDPSKEIAYRARLNRGRVLYDKGEVEAALAAYTDLLRQSEFRAYEGETRLLLGQYYWDRGLPAEALGEYERVRDDFPETDASAMALYHTGLLHLRQYGDRPRAQEYLEEVPKEKRDSEASRLAQDILGTMNQVDRLRRLVEQADSLEAAQADSATPATPDTAAAAAFETEVSAGAGVGTPPPPRRRPQSRAGGDPRGDMLANLFSIAELYRDALVLPDSAALFYGQIIQRFPDSTEMPRALYSLAWIELDMLHAPAAADPILRRLVDEYPETRHAQGARSLLGMAIAETAESRAAEEFARLEAPPPGQGRTAAQYLGQLDSLVTEYPATPTAARAAYLAAWTCENALGDTSAAAARYAEVLERFPSSPFSELIRRRREAEQAGVLAKLERTLHSLGEGLKSGERLTVLAIEPDSADTSSLARRFLGFALRAHRRGKLDSARELYEKVLEQRPTEARALFGLGDITWQRGYYEDAVDYLRQAIREGTSARARLEIVGAYYRLFAYHVRAGQADSANFYLREVIRRDRDNPEAAAVQDAYPRFAGAEPEDLELSALEEIQLEPPTSALLEPVQGAELTEPPVVRTSARAEYPDAAGGDSATVVLDVLIDEEGLPEGVAVFEGEPSFAAAAEAAARKYVFYPAEAQRGRLARVWVEIEIAVAPPAPGATTGQDSPPDMAAGGGVDAARRDDDP
ncbi:MAG: tetratricopeptide repeat protein [Gemmatimonadota bacterium]